MNTPEINPEFEALLDYIKHNRGFDFTGYKRPSLTPWLERYFKHSNGSYTFCPDLRRSVIFGRHDLLQDPPISRIDLLSCRNTLMYFHAETQAKIISRFHFALNDGSFLVLGKAELLVTANNSFVPLSLKQRIFIKTGLDRSREYFMGSNYGKDQDTNFIVNNSLLRDAVFDISPYAQIVVDISGLLVLANEQARLLFKLNSKDINRPLQELEVSYRPVELRSPINQVISTHRAIALSSIGWAVSKGDFNYFDVEITPLYDPRQNLLGVNVVFVEVSRYKKLQEEIENANQELVMAYEQLQSTNEELETTNEELQSANEELETTNEELQSTNEELETMNEELQSSNEELQTINAELRLRSEELNQANGFLEAIFNSLMGGVAVLNRESIIQVWNEKNEDLWGLRSQEVVGQHFMNLDIGLPVEQLRQPIRDCLSGDIKTIELSLVAVNRRGKELQAKVTCNSLVGRLDKIRGVIVLIEEINISQ